MLGRVLRVAGHAWLWGVAALVVVACVGTIASNGLSVGFANIRDWFSPFNVMNVIVLGVLAAPGLALVSLAEKVDRSRGERTPTK
jgi:hypothetical protein